MNKIQAVYVDATVFIQPSATLFIFRKTPEEWNIPSVCKMKRYEIKPGTGRYLRALKLQAAMFFRG